MTPLFWAAAAAAADCDKDLQVVLLEPERAATEGTPLAVLDYVTEGLFTAAFSAPLAAAVFELARREVEASLAAYQLAGHAEVRPASGSGRDRGWIFWDPATGVRQRSTLTAGQLEGKDMLTVHLDDPKDAAVRVGGASRVVVDIATFFGVDVAEKVYSRVVYDKMQAPMAEAHLTALVHTGRGVRCPRPPSR